MPMYEFYCPACGKKFEELVSSDTLPPCPACGNSETHKQVCACARMRSQSASSPTPAASRGCGGCSGGNCAGCGR